MVLPEDGKLLRLFMGENDRHDGMLLHEWIIRRAREEGLAGATVIRGIAGFGAHSRLHTAKILRLSTDLPIVVEIVDTEAKIEAFLPTLDAYGTSLLVTLEKMTVIRYGEDASGVTDG
jgi:hypothetical protein